MKKITLAVLAWAFASGALQAAPKYAPVNGTAAVTLARDNAYLRAKESAAPDYWALVSYYAPQKTGSSCSSASAAMALNALLNARRARGDEEENISEETVAAKAKTFEWSALVSEAGDGGRHGLKLEQLTTGLRESLAGFGAKAEVTAVEVSTPSKEALAAFRAALAANEASAADIMLLHFVQDGLTGAPGGPFAHISPVGAYDAATRRVLVMDVDRKWYEPYWVKDETLLKAMAVKTAAFGHGGYAVVKLAGLGKVSAPAN
jgi:hypothetical protein